MKKNILAACLSLIAVFILVPSLSDTTSAFDPFRVNQDPTVCEQTDANGNQSSLCSADGTTNPITGQNGVFNRIADIFAFITGAAAVFIIIIAGFEYVRSSGDSAKVNKAKDTILFAVVGLIVVILARFAVALAISKL